MDSAQAKIESIKEVVEILRELEEIDNELNKKCKQSGDNIDTLKKILTESNENLNGIIKNLSL